MNHKPNSCSCCSNSIEVHIQIYEKKHTDCEFISQTCWLHTVYRDGVITSFQFQHELIPLLLNSMNHDNHSVSDAEPGPD